MKCIDNISTIVDRVLNDNEKFSFYKNGKGVYLMFADHYWKGWSKKAKYVYIVNWTSNINGLNEGGLSKEKAIKILDTLDYDEIKLDMD